MKLVIDISEEEYKEVLEDTYSGTPYENKIFTIIADGTPYEERVFGKWIDTTGRGDLICSVCKHKAQIGCIEYCGACGAKMRKWGETR